MKVVLVNNSPIPPRRKYGGTERVVAWLAVALARRNFDVTVISPAMNLDRNKISWIPATTQDEALARIPKGADVVHFHGWAPNWMDEKKNWFRTIHGNEPCLDKLQTRVCFVSSSHAKNHLRECFVYNGVDAGEFMYAASVKPKSPLLFFSKVRRKVKGIRLALEACSRYRIPLSVAGGTRFDLLKTGGLLNSFCRGICFKGELAGRDKAEIFARSKALLFPIQWEEPFGLVMVEALMSGTPILATGYGSVPEIVVKDVGAVFTDCDDFYDAFESVDSLNRRSCREYALANFSSEIMARNYGQLYQKLVDGESVAW